MGYGDSLMDSGAARVAQLRDPRKVRILVGQRLIWSEIWDHNPRIAGKNETGDFQILHGRHPTTNMRPYHSAKSERQWSYNLSFRPEVGELYLSYSELQFANHFQPEVVVEPNIKPGASPNKQWPWENWVEFARLATKEGFRLTQMGPESARRLSLATMIPTRGFRYACAVMARARGFVGHEGGMHHAAATLNVRGVVIFGGFTPVELTGYSLHRNLGVSLGEACGMRVPCAHCALEMKKISPEQVLHQLKEVLQ